MAKASDMEVIQEMVELKKHINPQLMMDLVKGSEKKQLFKPTKIKYSTEIARFLSERFDKGV